MGGFLGLSKYETSTSSVVKVPGPFYFGYETTQAPDDIVTLSERQSKYETSTSSVLVASGACVVSYPDSLRVERRHYLKGLDMRLVPVVFQ